MATISITRKIEFNKSDAKKIAQACSNVEKLTVRNNPQKIEIKTFIEKLIQKKT